MFAVAVGTVCSHVRSSERQFAPAMLQCYNVIHKRTLPLRNLWIKLCSAIRILRAHSYSAQQSVHKYTPSDNSRTLDLWSSLCSFKRINAHEPSGILSSSGVARCIVAREFLNEPPISALYIQLPRALCQRLDIVESNNYTRAKIRSRVHRAFGQPLLYTLYSDAACILSGLSSSFFRTLEALPAEIELLLKLKLTK